MDEDVEVKQEFIEDEVGNLTIEKIAASKGLTGALHELQLGTDLASLQKKWLTDRFFILVYFNPALNPAFNPVLWGGSRWAIINRM